MRQLATAAPERMRSSAETPTGQELDLWIVAEAAVRLRALRSWKHSPASLRARPDYA